MKPTVLMCRPDFYGVQYEINPWMDTAREVDHAEAVRQWERLRQLIEGAGAEVGLVPPVKGLPDLVFTANAALIYRRRAVLSCFRHSQRQGEEAHFRVALEAQGFGVCEPPGSRSFEGAGDALFCGDALFAGYMSRSDAAGHQRIAELLGIGVLPLELVDPYYYHLDTCFCPLVPGVAAYFPRAFDDYGRRVLRENVPVLIEVAEGEAREFACNAVVIGKRVITNEGCPDFHRSLGGLGFDPVATPLHEFVKAGGSAKCLTLRLDGEDAAGWRSSG
ncbi:MAG: arginine deiminase-related protein [Planctomycetota bacterium]